MFKNGYFQKTVSGWEGVRRGWGGERPAKKNIIRDDGKDCCPNPLQQVLENIKSNKIIFIAYGEVKTTITTEGWCGHMGRVIRL